VCQTQAPTLGDFSRILDGGVRDTVIAVPIRLYRELYKYVPGTHSFFSVTGSTLPGLQLGGAFADASELLGFGGMGRG